jgi:hypothetical protein
MKLIYSKSRAITNVATAVTASSENAAYPASNLLLGNVSKVYRSLTGSPTIATATLTVAVPAGVTNAIGIFGANCDTIKVDVKNVAEDTTYFTETFDLTPSSPLRKWNRVWKEWTSNGFALHIVITLTATSTATYHEIGEIAVGETVTIPDSLYGLSQARENFQIVQSLVGGGFYIHDGPRPRSFDLAWIMTRDTEFDDIDEIYSVIGQNPVAMLLSDNLNNDMKWCGYFHIVDAPNIVQNTPTMGSANMSIREAV